MENRKREIEVFSAGCSACHEAVELVRRPLFTASDVL